MNKNGTIAVVIVIGAIVLIGLWVVRSGQTSDAARQDCTAPPAAPLAVVARVEAGMVALSWTAAEGEPATSHVIEAGSTPGASDQGTFVSVGSETAFERAAPAGTYHVRVFARNACGTSPAAEETTVTVP